MAVHGYNVTGEQLLVETSPGETILNLFAPGTTRKAEMGYVSVSAGGTMADQVQRVQLQRTTVVGTEGAGVVPEEDDPDGPAAVFDAGEDHSAEPTYTAGTELWDEDVHVRNTPQIQLQQDMRWKLVAVANNGIGMRSFSSNYAGPAHGTMHFLE